MLLWIAKGKHLQMNPDCGPILVVDDDAVFRELLVTLLGRLDLRIVEASGADQALEAARRERPSLVLLDVDVPGISGYEICRELRDAYGDDLPIVFVSGRRTDRLDRVSGLLLGADDYLVKPFTTDELLARVRRCLARSQPPEPTFFADGAPPKLTGREDEILRLLAGGLDQRAIAARLVISPKTVATHIQRILGKIGVGSRAQAVAYAHRNGLAQSDRGAYQAPIARR
jgi:DNA-binding NarL/FixJ family response regulator